MHDRSLDWDVGQPNGGETQNKVSFSVTGGAEKAFLGDNVDNVNYCTYCSVSDSIRLTLWGVCPGSYLGGRHCITAYL